MLARYERRRVDDVVRALREILQEIALLGLWRSRFFERPRFTADGAANPVRDGPLREDLDFSLLKPAANFDLSRYSDALQKEIRSFGFEATVTKREKASKAQSSRRF